MFNFFIRYLIKIVYTITNFNVYNFEFFDSWLAFVIKSYKKYNFYMGRTK